MTDKPGTIYIAKLTPDFLVEVKKKNTIMWDVEFSPSEALLGMAGVSNPGGAVERTYLAFRARTNAPVREAELKSFSLPAQILGKSPNFWWLMLSERSSVFDHDSRTLYHIVLATFDDGNPPKTLDSVLNSVAFDATEGHQR